MVSSERCLAEDDELSTNNMKEMIGGCCVCSDERGWAENPLVYCDGHGCNVAVHQACYGIVQVPTGPWFCRKCESQERAARVRCELCPHKDGALKRTDNGGSILLAMHPHARAHTHIHICGGELLVYVVINCMSPASLRGVSVLGELCCCLLSELLLCTVLASACFMRVCECVCMFMRGRARMGIVHGL
ncbi:protein AF-10-like [Solea solea]|uniref:protein AF-10-like n=1 Tax=Solea solea TaxID=90069 RepID=UPI002729CE8D|nr:protein AF-10-like [Solea solea]